MLWPKRVLYVGYALAALALGQHWGVPLVQILVLVALPLTTSELILRYLCSRQLKRFERELMGALQRGAGAELLQLYRRQWLLRIAAPRHALLARLGLIHARLADPEQAVVAFRAALEEAPAGETALLSRKLADACYAAQRYDEAERYYRQSQNDRSINAGVRARLARLILQRGGDAGEAEQLLRQAVEAARGSPGCGALRAQLVALLATRGHRDDALWHMQIAEEELGSDATPEEQQLLQQARDAVAALMAPAVARPDDDVAGAATPRETSSVG